MQGLIPQVFIDELLTQVDIVEFIDSYVPLKKQGSSHVACCPFHSEKNPSFNVIPKKQFYHCFGCGESGNLISFAMNYLQLSFPAAIETLAARAGLQVPRANNTEKYHQSLSLYQLLDKVTRFYQNTLKNHGYQAISYLKQRQVSGDIAKRYQIGYAPNGWHTLESAFPNHITELITTGMLIKKDDGKSYDRYRNRIIFPIHDRQGRIIGFGGRVLDAHDKPKYLNSPETVIFQKNRELYGLHQALQQNRELLQVLIVEGYMDVIALAQHGINNAVATLGTATSSYHIQLLSKHTKKLIFCFDGDNAGRTAAWRAVENSLLHLDNGLDCCFIFLPDGHDPDTLIREEGAAKFNQRLLQATPLNQFFFDTLTKDLDHTTLNGKNQLINASIPYLQKMPDGAYKQLLVNELARLTRIENHRIHQLIHNKTPETAKVDVMHQIARTPLRVATALLLQHPDLYSACHAQIHPEKLDDKRQHVLKTMIAQVAQSPTINTAGLVELWRDSSLFESINKLAAWSHQVPEDALSREFIDIVQFLTRQNQENQIQKLIEQSRQQGLTTIEQHTLQNLLKNRHQHNKKIKN
jgi:DNA primase